MQVTNLAFYHFFQVPGSLEETRQKIKLTCLELGFKGTVILAREGINLMVAGEPEKIKEFKSFLQAFTSKKDLFFKESSSSYIPFNRMIVKVKQQTIPVNDPDVAPEKSTSPHLSPEKLKQWLDEKRELILLDTRNQFEFEVGTFEQAKPIDVKHFRDFEEKLSHLPKDWKKKTVVAFCTGGIRCEKATPIMAKHGFKKVYQLEGGILNYFEKVGGDHYRGDCFVFDRRVALDTHLQETEIVECFNCKHPVTPEEQKLNTYQYEVSCPYCYGQKKHGF